MLFDLDGVLIHSMPVHTDAWRQYLIGLGVEAEYLEDRMHGKRNPELVRDLLGSHLSEEAVFEHGAAKERLFRQMVMEAGIDQYRVNGLTEFLRRHEDVPKAIGSNAELANIDFVLDRFGLREYFAAIVDGHQVGRPKPFPDIYLRAAELLDVEPASCIVFEDSPTGVAAGIAARMRVVGIETTPADLPGVSLKVPDFLDPRLESWWAAQESVLTVEE